MAITITVTADDNHTISSSKKILSRQGELGETITFSLPSTLNVAYPRAWIMVQQPDGQLYYIDNGSGAGFTWPNPYTFTYNIGDRDTMLSSDGTIGIQIVLRDATPPAQTVEWRSRILYLTIEGSILSNVDSGGSLIDSLSSGTLNRLADIQYDSLADGDLLYRDTATGKWRNVTLVDGLNITHTLNKSTGELTLNSSGTIPLKADNILLDDTAGRISSTQVEGAIAEIAGTGRTIESLANIGLLSSLKTTEKGTVVGSINEVNAQLAQKPNEISGLDGTLDLTGGLIKFPATQSASSDPNTLDDYEEGTFTPTIVGASTAGTCTYTFRSGKYTKVGNKVYIEIILSWSSHTGTGNFIVSGLPFTISSGRQVFSLGVSSLTYSGQLTSLGNGNTTGISLYSQQSGLGITDVAIDTSADYFVLSGTYIAN